MSILKVDMTQKEIVSEPFPNDKIVGGRGMVDYLLTEYGIPTAHPLAPESIFVAAPGLLAGSGAPNRAGYLSEGKAR